MNTKDVLVKAVEVITFLFAAFSGFLTSIAPPEEANASFAVGICSLLAVALLLFISAVSKTLPRRRHRSIWLAVSLALFVAAGVSAMIYKSNLDALTFSYPPGNTKPVYVRGAELTTGAKKYLEENPTRTIPETVADFGGLSQRELVWTDDSMRRARLTLTVSYVALALSLSATIFCLTEGLLVAHRPSSK